MIFRETSLKGAYIIELEPITDSRGSFAVGWNKKEFSQRGLSINFVQFNLSRNVHRGTLRGLHSRKEPYQEEKLIRCTRGVIYDVIVDTRPGSSTHGQWIGSELSADNGRMIYVPKGFLHGYITLTDDTEVQYQVSRYHEPEAEIGARYDDPAFNIEWPIAVTQISDKDKAWPVFQPDQLIKTL